MKKMVLGWEGKIKLQNVSAAVSFYKRIKRGPMNRVPSKITLLGANSEYNWYSFVACPPSYNTEQNGPEMKQVIKKKYLKNKIKISYN